MNPLFAVALFFAAFAASARPMDEGCDALQAKYNATAGAAQTTPLQRVNALLHLLAATPDDPENCITSKTIDQINDIEKTLITLEVNGKEIRPDWVLACHSVNLRSGECLGAELDTSSSLPEKGMRERLKQTVPRGPTAVLKLNSGYRATVVGAFRDAGTGLRPLKMEGNRLMLAKLETETDHPSVTILLRRGDGLRFRKVVWHLYPLEAAGRR